MGRNLLSLAKDWLARAPQIEKTSSEISLTDQEEESLSWAQGKLSRSGSSKERGGCARVFYEGKVGIAAASGLDPSSASQLFSLAKSGAALKSVSQKGRLAGPLSRTSRQPVSSLNQRLSLNEKKDFLKSLEDQVLKLDRRVKAVIRENWVERKSNFALATSGGFLGEKQEGSHSFMVEILAESKGESQVAWDFLEETQFSTEKISRAVHDCALRAVESLGAVQIPTRKIPILVAPQVGVQLLSLLSKALSGEEAEMNRTFLKGRLNQIVAAKELTLVDDGLAPGGVATAPFDDEGIAQSKKSVVENGVFKTFFHSLRSAEALGCDPTGNSIKPGWASPPSPQPTNFFIQPGPFSKEDLLSREKEIFEVKEIMGLHMADPISGEFSFGASGVLWDRGKFKTAVRGVTWAGTLEGLLKNIQGIGSPLRWYGNLGSPSFLTQPLPISGQ